VKRSGSVAGLLRQVRLVAFDFDGVFTDNSVYVSDEGRESVRCWRGDGIGLSALASLGIATVVISTERNSVVQHRSRKMGIRCFHGCDDKVAVLRQVADELSIQLDHVAFVGNDVNDLGCLSIVGLPIVVADAHPAVKSAALYSTKATGGHGAVREICDMIAEGRARG
jgi:YrbI family 3-deoxy-D-manno-octulosonate 8-phosphate phosphatase